MVTLLPIIAIGLLLGLLSAEKTESTRLILIFKTPLSCLFVLIALLVPHPLPSYFLIILIGLVLGLIGDVCLAIPGKRTFTAGLAVFLIGHIFYIVAFIFLSPLSSWPHPSCAPVLLFTGGTFLWLRPHLKEMLIPVALYIVVITLMMIGAIAVFRDPSMTKAGAWAVLLGGVLFGLSDFFVASHRFKKQRHINKLLGLPLYYAGQFLLAFSVGMMERGL